MYLVLIEVQLKQQISLLEQGELFPPANVRRKQKLRPMKLIQNMQPHQSPAHLSVALSFAPGIAEVVSVCRTHGLVLVPVEKLSHAAKAGKLCSVAHG